ncbi:hypothetical protein Pint_33009 [Pistacia integerrima]|uniref:Uncharacterized protein n=1 Tax=Pistacia integerrima TaxID=434235 RepID=A0ACC0X6K2_9ROSI|nr:hypothetical protein Pint_33009 [Pistacia integerrima]
MTEPSKEAVCVTGANGFIGSWLVQTLLTTGYTTIHATIYPGSDPSHLFTLRAASKANLKVFEADILDDVAVSRAVEGCTGVFHVASPCTLEDPQDPQEELVLPAVQGTLNVLEAAKKFKVRRVVLTSSISALVPNPGWPRDKVFNETSWTDLDYCKSRQKWYPVSKTLAEKAAWEFAEKNGIDVVAIHPATCLGPLLQPYLQQLLQGYSSCCRVQKILKSITGWELCMSKMLQRCKCCYLSLLLLLVDIFAPMVSISLVNLLKESPNSSLNFRFTGLYLVQPYAMYLGLLYQNTIS